jgi:NAD(P)-dependent dehydrogenase (short-subunit alcohol dehydrogenase family)
MVDRRTPNVVFPSLRDRVAIITGAGQGLGCAFAKGFAAGGAIAIIAERNGERGEAVAAEIAAAGGKAYAIMTDIADPASLENMIAVVEQAYGRIDILVNNAAIFSTLDMRPFEQSSSPRKRHSLQCDQLFFAPSRIHARMALRSQIDSFFLPCGIRTSGDARQSSSHIKLLPSGSRGMTIAPNLVPFINPS